VNSPELFAESIEESQSLERTGKLAAALQKARQDGRSG
jgi:hypothetical protein